MTEDGTTPAGNDATRILAGRLAIVARLGAFPDRLARAARAVESSEVAAGRPDGEWTPREVVAHLVAVEREIWHGRLDSLPTGDGPEPAWAYGEPAPTGDPGAATLDGALELFAVVRAQTLERVAALDEAGWARTGIHATYGRLDVAALLRTAADHDDDHLGALQARAGSRGSPA